MDKVMLIDNGTKIASFISRCLTRNGLDVITVSDLKGSIFKVQAGDADIIIINSTDTGQSTYDVCKRIRSIQETDSIPILLMGDSESTTSV
ncbi:MAG: hypothetical protein LBM16_05230, partial [Clostridiales bacterium]|nr:hypothetical protein [Clostridiales bacterium]